MNDYKKEMEELANSIQSKDFESSIFRSVERINIYRMNYVEGTIQLLGHKYPSIAFLMQDNNFRYTCFQFLVAYPPQKPDKNIYGSEFSSYLSNASHVDFPKLSADIAKLDLAFYNRDDANSDLAIQVSKNALNIWRKIKQNKSRDEINQMLKLVDSPSISLSRKQITF